MNKIDIIASELNLTTSQVDAVLNLLNVKVERKEQPEENKEVVDNKETENNKGE